MHEATPALRAWQLRIREKTYTGDAIDLLIKRRMQLKPSLGSQRKPHNHRSSLKDNCNCPGICWTVNTTGQKQSRFLNKQKAIS